MDACGLTGPMSFVNELHGLCRRSWSSHQVQSTQMSPQSISSPTTTYLYGMLLETTDISVLFASLMAEMLSFLGSRSTGYIWDTELKLEYTDENFAREIMQLFTIGLCSLNRDGTKELDAEGVPIRTHTNFDVTEYARVCTDSLSPSAKERECRSGVLTVIELILCRSILS